MFWIPSNRLLDLAWLGAVPAQLSKQLASILAVGDAGVGGRPAGAPFLFLPVLLLSLALFLLPALAERQARPVACRHRLRAPR